MTVLWTTRKLQVVLRLQVCNIQYFNNNITLFSSAEGGNQLVVTSRIVGYHSRPLLKGSLTHVTVEPMDDTAISHFCDAWMAALAKKNKIKSHNPASFNNFPQVSEQLSNEMVGNLSISFHWKFGAWYLVI